MRWAFNTTFYFVHLAAGSTCDPCNKVKCGHGTCKAGKCTCQGGYSGNLCETQTNKCYRVNCGAHGSCVEGHCVCKDGYLGKACQSAPDPCEFPSALLCGAHGTCAGGRCKCTSGWKGFHCEINVRGDYGGSSSSSGASSHGGSSSSGCPPHSSSNSRGSCSCNSGYHLGC